jgi:hypothetical protein
LADKDVAELVESAVYEGYEQKGGKRIGIYRA